MKDARSRLYELIGKLEYRMERAKGKKKEELAEIIKELEEIGRISLKEIMDKK
ncbi:hypothetical protein [Sigmofec virus UA08Rod_5306]|uniref:Uncharacterized protein n=1 Tax=Sigmofec virus UA08Rod_5306 TaxID=2929417 RepID=A0A976N0Y1_9VIRU|nr:hypothetical protein [Sigmofec virus UA08Rod_5306]